MRKALVLLSAVAFFGPALTCRAADVKVVKNIPYYKGKDADPVRHKLDLYLPKGEKNFPVLFFIHGGGWRKGSKEKFAHLGMTFAKHGIGTVTINYRLSPQVKHPGHIEDVARAFAWTVKNIGDYGGDATRIFVSGHSAGGHLAALLATDPRYLEAHGLKLENIRGVIPISGVYLIPDRLASVFGDEKARKAASPINHVTGKRPPFLFLWAEKDIPNCGQLSKQMSEMLRKHGGEASYMMIPDRNHGTIVRNISNEGDPATTAMLRFIRKHSGK